jgi:hypothetical protein
MAELNRKEEGLVMRVVKEVAAEPGLPARDLGILLHSQMATVLRVVQKLVESGIVERRQVRRTRSDGQERGYNGLYLADKKPETLETQPETMETSEKPRTPGKVTSQRTALRELGERLGWSRVPITQAREDGGGFRRGRVIDGGEDGWRRAVEELSDEDVEVALSAGRRLLVLLGLR